MCLLAPVPVVHPGPTLPLSHFLSASSSTNGAGSEAGARTSTRSPSASSSTIRLGQRVLRRDGPLGITYTPGDNLETQDEYVTADTAQVRMLES